MEGPGPVPRGVGTLQGLLPLEHVHGVLHDILALVVVHIDRPGGHTSLQPPVGEATHCRMEWASQRGALLKECDYFESN